MNERRTYVFPLDEGALRATLDPWAESHPGCSVLALVPEAEAKWVPALQAAARASGVRLVGGVFPKVIRSGRFIDQGAWLLRLPGHPPLALIEELGDVAAAAALAIAAPLGRALANVRGASPADAGPHTLFLMFDGTTPIIGSILDEMFLQLGGGVRYLGVNAGSETFQPVPCLFDGDRVVQGGALWILLPDDGSGAVLHDYVAPAEPSVATATSGNRIRSIDFRPALTFYEERMREQYGLELSPATFYRYAVEYPLAILLASGELVVRMPVACDADGTISCLGEVPEHALLVVARAPRPTDGEEGATLCGRLAAGKVSGPSLLFYCAGRRMRMGESSEEDLRAILATLGDDAAGALSLGEIGCTERGAYPLFHNGAIVRVGWG